jgi:hypothetical protein
MQLCCALEAAHRHVSTRPRLTHWCEASGSVILRRWLAGAVCVLGLGVGAGAPASSEGPSTAPVVTIALRAPADTPIVTVGGDLPVNPIAPGFLGLSLEYTALLPYAGQSGTDPVFLRLIRQLNPGQSPVLRIGGDSTDWSWVPVRGVVKPPGVTYTITPRWLTALRGLVRAVHAHAIFGVNLEANSSAVAAAEGRALVGAVGRSSLQALELGNEPELYGALGWYATRRGTPVTGRPASYDLGSYAADFARIAGSLRDVPLAGPATGSPAWMRRLPAFLAGAPPVRVVTVHRYPLNRCSSVRPTIARLLSTASSAGLARSVARAASVAHAHHARFRVDELNSASCRGQRGVSNTFASALWVLDALFNLARVNVDGVNIHTLPASVYHPFVLARTGNVWRWTVDPLYYGMLTFSRAAPPGSHLLSISASVVRPLRMWATRAPNGQTRVVLINESRRESKYVSVRVPGARSAAELTWLRAPSIAAADGITLGGQSFGAATKTGGLTGDRQRIHVAAIKDTYVVKLPPASGAMLTSPAPR